MKANTTYNNSHVKKAYILSAFVNSIGRLLLSPFVGKVVTFCREKDGLLSPFVGKVVTFCRKKDGLLSPFVGKVVTFCREGCHLLSEEDFSNHSLSICYNIFATLINNLKNNLINYSNKLFDKDESLPKTFWGGFEALAFNNKATLRKDNMLKDKINIKTK